MTIELRNESGEVLETANGIDFREAILNALAQRELQVSIVGNEEYFPVTSVSRDDLIQEGWRASTLDDDKMRSIADKMGNALMDCGYWDVLNGVAQYFDLEQLSQNGV